MEEKPEKRLITESDEFKAYGVTPDQVTTLVPHDGGINMAMGFADDHTYSGALHITAWHYTSPPADGEEPPTASFVVALNDDDQIQLLGSVLALSLPNESVSAALQMIIFLKQKALEEGKLSYAEDAASKSYGKITELLNDLEEES